MQLSALIKSHTGCSKKEWITNKFLSEHERKINKTLIFTYQSTTGWADMPEPWKVFPVTAAVELPNNLQVNFTRANGGRDTEEPRRNPLFKVTLYDKSTAGNRALASFNPLNTLIGTLCTIILNIRVRENFKRHKKVTARKVKECTSREWDNLSTCIIILLTCLESSQLQIETLSQRLF